MLEDKDMEIKYIRSEENPTYIMTKNGSDTYYAKHVNNIRGLWELLETGRENINNNGVLDGVMNLDLTEYSTHALTDAMNKWNKNDWILVTRYRNS